MEEPGSGGQAPPAGGFRGFLAQAQAWVKANLVETLITAAIAFAIGWFINVYVVAYRYEGTVAGTGGTATVAGNWLTGSLFWLILAAVLTTLVTYGRRVGPQRLVGELVVLPRNLLRGFSTGNEGWSLMLFGAALSMVIAVIFGAAAAGVSGLALLVVAASPVVGALGRLIRKLGIRALALAAGDKANGLASASALTSVLGAALGMVVAWQVPGTVPKLVTAAVALLASVLVLRGGGGTQTAATVVLGALAFLALRELFDGVALADDGGWREGGGSLGSWLGSQGSTTVMTNSTVAGGMAGVGSVAGTATGQVLASTASDAGLGGLSGEWGAQEAGAEPVAASSAPTAPAEAGQAPVVAPPDTGEPDASSTGEAGGSDGGAGDAGGGAPGGGPGGAGDAGGGAPGGGPGGAGDAGGGDAGGGAGTEGDDASLGGLSGQWTGEGQPPQPPPSQAPPDASGGAGRPPVPPPDDGREER